MENCAERMQEQRICVVLPTYNNARTILQVIADVAGFCHDIFVVNDGCTDETPQLLSPESIHNHLVSNSINSDIRVLSYTPNKGKGFALVYGFREALKQGFHYAITMDSDGQHFATDIPAFVEANRLHPDTLLIGSRNLQQENMPQKNTFANKFSNFWYTVQTAHVLPDTQTGFRLYPLQKMGRMRLMTSRYEAELELLVRSTWRGIQVMSLPIRVYYPPQEERVSHFRPGKDFTRISLLNTFFCFAAILYGYPSMLIHKIAGK